MRQTDGHKDKVVGDERREGDIEKRDRQTSQQTGRQTEKREKKEQRKGKRGEGGESENGLSNTLLFSSAKFCYSRLGLELNINIAKHENTSAWSFCQLDI